MKIDPLFALQEVADEYIVVPIGKKAATLHGIIKLNETGASLWKALSFEDLSEDDLISVITSTYNVERKCAKNDVQNFVKFIRDLGCLV